MLQITVKNERQHLQFTHAAGPLEIGRAPSDEGTRFVVEDRYVSRQQLKVEETPDGRLRLENLGSSPLTLSDGTSLERGEQRSLSFPVRLTVGYTVVDFAQLLPDSRDSSLRTINRPIRGMRGDEPSSSLAALGESPSPDVLTEWFETLLSVQRAAAGSAEFYDETARAVVELVGLDRGLVLLRRHGQWQVAASAARRSDLHASFSQSVLSQVLAQERTFYQTPEGSSAAASLLQVEAVVASPIFDPDDRIVGAVYGSRDFRSETGRRGIQPLEAQVVQLLAATVSAGLVRQEREAEAARMRARFEEFFSVELARELERNPTMLEAKDREITILFADLRGFSRISELLGTSETYRLMSEVMDALTDCVLMNQGVVIDYFGDGLAAMWNAPRDQADHADLACLAALGMQQALSALRHRWQQRIGQVLQLGIGIHTGVAQVGNAGSSRRIKYGPRGHAMNLASRIEGATKQLGVKSLMSAETRQRLKTPLATRRLCRVRVLGIEGTVELHELYQQEADSAWLARRDLYEQALRLFESQRPAEAAEVLERLQADPAGQDDSPARLLAHHASQAASNQTLSAFEPVITLESK